MCKHDIISAPTPLSERLHFVGAVTSVTSLPISSDQSSVRDDLHLPVSKRITLAHPLKLSDSKLYVIKAKVVSGVSEKMSCVSPSNCRVKVFILNQFLPVKRKTDFVQSVSGTFPLYVSVSKLLYPKEKSSNSMRK